LALVAETTTGALYSAEFMAKGGETPEDLGLVAAKMLYREVALGGTVDTLSQWIVLLLMTLCPEDVSKVRFGKLSEFSYFSRIIAANESIQFLRDLKEVLGVVFKIKPDDAETKTVLLSCLGVGFVNVNKKTT
jgi:RNA 3'-terminal phosphate cyclase-like protein